jgi:hypothetical protein
MEKTQPPGLSSDSKKGFFSSQRHRGCWYNEDTNERLFPDLNSETTDPHWDYYGPDFSFGARLYIDGTWSRK